MPDHHQAAKGHSGEKETPKVNLAMVFRGKQEVMHAEKTANGSSTKSRQNDPNQQKDQMVAQVQHQQAKGEGVVDLAEKGHVFGVLIVKLKVEKRCASLAKTHKCRKTFTRMYDLVKTSTYEPNRPISQKRDGAVFYLTRA